MKIDFDKSNGLVPVIIQHVNTLQVLMLGYMNEEALNKTLEEGKVTFYSRSKKGLWTKGEKSGNYLLFQEMMVDCDQDTILIKAIPLGPTCHTLATSCFGEPDAAGFIYALQETISDRINSNNVDSYTRSLVAQGIAKIAQKVGEEAVELVIEAMQNEQDRFKDEAADLLFHLLVLLRAKSTRLQDIESVLRSRMKP